MAALIAGSAARVAVSPASMSSFLPGEVVVRRIADLGRDHDRQLPWPAAGDLRAHHADGMVAISRGLSGAFAGMAAGIDTAMTTSAPRLRATSAGPGRSPRRRRRCVRR